MTRKPPQRLFIPGPTDVLPQVLAAQTAPMIGHRTSEFESLFEKVQIQLRQMYYTEESVYVVAASGSGLQEAAIRNAVGGRVLSEVNGAFGRRWFQVAEACGKSAIPLEVQWNQAAKPEAVMNALRKAVVDDHVDAVSVVHNETSTGVMNPVADIAAAIHEVSPDTQILVDAVSSFGGVRIPFDEWKLDVCLTSSQKALALPPGLAMCAVRERVLERARNVGGRGWYFDFLNLERSLNHNTTPATPAVSLMRALSVQLDHIFDEGLETRYRRHERLAARVRAWAVGSGFELAAEEGYRSPTVTSIGNTRQVDVAKLNRFLAERNMKISDGYGPFKGKAFRIAHMGETTEEDIERLLTCIDEFLGTNY